VNAASDKSKHFQIRPFHTEPNKVMRWCPWIKTIDPYKAIHTDRNQSGPFSPIMLRSNGPTNYIWALDHVLKVMWVQAKSVNEQSLEIHFHTNQKKSVLNPLMVFLYESRLEPRPKNETSSIPVKPMQFIFVL